jgi:CheY-like chemotaxis protein
MDKLSILIVDDQVEVLDVYHDVLQGELGHQVDCVTMPGEALRCVRDTLFDVVIVDAKNGYKGAPLGGLILAEEVSAILGLGSVLLMSQYDVRDEVRHYNPTFTFIPKPRNGNDLLAWVKKDLLAKVRAMVERQYGFVAMPFCEESSNDWYQRRVVPWMGDAGFVVRRMDEIQTTRPINAELLTRIRRAHFVVLCAVADNPNVYFEAGYACAHDKFVVVVAPERREMPFDVRANHVLALGEVSDEGAARASLLAFMAGLRGIRPSRPA